MVETAWLELFFVGILLVWIIKVWWQGNAQRITQWWKQTKARLPRHWQPKSPKDCPQCRAGIQLHRHNPVSEVVPWASQKSRRGAKKRLCTQGLACLNPVCPYFGIRDAACHVPPGHGKRGQDHDIQYLKCQACQKTFTSRKGTPLYYLKTKANQVEMVLRFLVEGVDLSVMVRYRVKAEMPP